METSCWFLAISLIYLATGQQEVSVSQQEVSVRLLQDVTLACHGGVANISVLKWSRSDLSGGGYVYFYRNKRSFECYQHRHFHGRVMLRDAAMTGGDASLILRNASFLDTGIYECHLQGPGPEVRCSVNLTVTDTVETPAAMMDGGIRPEDADGDGGKETGTSNSITAAAAGVAAGVVAAVIVV